MARVPLPNPLPWDPGDLVDPVAIIRRARSNVSYPGFIRSHPVTPQGRSALEALGHPEWDYRRLLADADRFDCLRALEKSEWDLVVHLPEPWWTHKGDAFAGIVSAGGTNYRSGIGWVIRKSEVEDPGCEPLLYQTSNGFPCRRGVRFNAWFAETWRRMIKRIGAGHARLYLDGPRPFTPEEAAIAIAWRGFSWKLVGRDPDNLHLKVRNDSQGWLRRYTVRCRDTGFTGGFMLDVADLGPGEERLMIVPLGGYAHLTTTSAIRLESMPEPRPETRRDYGEFRHILSH